MMVPKIGTTLKTSDRNKEAIPPRNDVPSALPYVRLSIVAIRAPHIKNAAEMNRIKIPPTTTIKIILFQVI